MAWSSPSHAGAVCQIEFWLIQAFNLKITSVGDVTDNFGDEGAAEDET
jgi:hypothetical protein